MESDRKLLTLAAKAVGLVLQLDYDGNFWAHAEDEHPELGRRWNPLTDDGDALRLAVARWIEIRVFNGKAHAGKQNVFWCTEDCGLDPYAATRRAIVRAAAKLAQAHPGHKDGGANG